MGHSSLSVDEAFGTIPKYLVPLGDKAELHLNPAILNSCGNKKNWNSLKYLVVNDWKSISKGKWFEVKIADFHTKVWDSTGLGKCANDPSWCRPAGQLNFNSHLPAGQGIRQAVCQINH